MKKQIVFVVLAFTTSMVWAQQRFDAKAYIQKEITAGKIKAPKEKNGMAVYKSSDIKKLNDQIQTFIQQGGTSFQAKDFAKAQSSLDAAYALNKEVNNYTDTVRLYYAAVAGLQGNIFDTTDDMLQELIKLGYTGISKKYYATDAKGEKVTFDSKVERDLALKNKDNPMTNPGEENSENELGNIYYYHTYCLDKLGKSEEALEVANMGYKKFPENSQLGTYLANAYYKAGRLDDFLNLTLASVEKDPKNPDLLYNTGVAYNKLREQAAEDGNAVDVQKYKDLSMSFYKRAIEADPNYTNAYINMASVILDQEKAIVDEINSLPMNRAGQQKVEELEQQRKTVFTAAMPYLEKARQLSPKNKGILETLKGIYFKTNDMTNYNAVKAELEALK